MFVAGAATEGPGMIVTPMLKDHLRSHHDIDRDSAKHFKRASKVRLLKYPLTESHLIQLDSNMTFQYTRSQFYEGLAKRAAENGHAIDLFTGCLDQVGLLEMKSLANFTNGVMVISDSFATSIFKTSFHRLFDKDAEGHLRMGFNATFDVQVRTLSLSRSDYV